MRFAAEYVIFEPQEFVSINENLSVIPVHNPLLIFCIETFIKWFKKNTTGDLFRKSIQFLQQRPKTYQSNLSSIEYTTSKICRSLTYQSTYAHKFKNTKSDLNTGKRKKMAT